MLQGVDSTGEDYGRLPHNVSVSEDKQVGGRLSGCHVAGGGPVEHLMAGVPEDDRPTQPIPEPADVGDVPFP
jgi:hypothetical protein